MNAEQFVAGLIREWCENSDKPDDIIGAAAELIMSRLHVRKCHSCNHIDLHADTVIPYVVCRKCRSADTRRIKQKPTAQEVGE